MTCKDALTLLQERREAARRGDTHRIKAIDNERFAHDEESPNCQCWTKAILEAARERAA